VKQDVLVEQVKTTAIVQLMARIIFAKIRSGLMIV
jgi:hypothetical protein